MGGFLDSTLVTPTSPPSSLTSSKSKNTDPLAACNLQQQHSAPSTRAIQSTRSPLREFERAAVELKDLTKSTAAAFFDLRNFRAPLRTDYELPFLTSTSLKPVSSDMGVGRSVARSRPSSPRKDESDPTRIYESNGRKRRTEKSSTGIGKVYLLGGAGPVDWEETASNPSLSPAIVDALERFYRVSFRTRLVCSRRLFANLACAASRRTKPNSTLRPVPLLSKTSCLHLRPHLASFPFSTSMVRQLSSSFLSRTNLISSSASPTRRSCKTLEQSL